MHSHLNLSVFCIDWDIKGHFCLVKWKKNFISVEGCVSPQLFTGCLHGSLILYFLLLLVVAYTLYFDLIGYISVAAKGATLSVEFCRCCFACSHIPNINLKFWLTES